MSDENRIGVFLVDDHAVVRRGRASFLEGEPDMHVVGHADSGRRALDELAVHDRAGTLPDVVLMDLLMPDLDGIAATVEVTRRRPSVAVVAVTSFLEEAQVRRALDAGASGYLLKDADAEDVAAAVRAAYRGEAALAPRVARALVDSVRRARADTAGQLTARETEVVTLVALGYTNQQIASRFGVAERTARTHVSNILAKLGLSSRTQAALWAVEKGLTTGS